MSDVTIIITDSAAQTIRRMHERVTDVALEYGEHSEEHLKALRSFMEALMGIIRLGGRISQDSDLSLLGVSWITYGVIFHAKYINGTERDPLLGDWSIHS